MGGMPPSCDAIDIDALPCCELDHQILFEMWLNCVMNIVFFFFSFSSFQEYDFVTSDVRKAFQLCCWKSSSAIEKTCFCVSTKAALFKETCQTKTGFE